MKKYILFLLVLLSIDVFPQSSLPDTTSIDERIQTIEQMLGASRKSASLWNNTWLYGYSAATVVQGAVSIGAREKSLRQDMALGAGTTLLGAAFQMLSPLDIGSSADVLSQMPDSTVEEKILKLQLAEETLQKISKREKDGRSWQIHGLNTAVNLSSGLITWLGFKRSFRDGVVNFLINTVITETQIWTQPTRVTGDYRQYYNKYKEKNMLVTQKKPPVELLLRTYPSGVALIIQF